MTFQQPLTWTCHICKEERPDAKISVRKNKAEVSGVEFENNVRYCNDQPDCILAAATFVHTGKLVE